MISPTRAVYEVARKEVMEHFRTKRMYIIGGLYALTFLAAAIIVPVVSRGRDLSPDESITQVLSFYNIFGGAVFTSLLALVFTADAICGEWKDRSLFLLFSKPVPRWTVLAGKVVAAFASVLLVMVTVFTLALAVMLVLLGLPEAATFGQIARGFGVFALAVIPFVAFGTLCTAVFKSPLTSFIVAMGMRFVGFSLLSTLGFFVVLFTAEDVSFQDLGNNALLKFFSLLNPSNLMSVGASLMISNQAQAEGGFGLGFALDIPTTLLAILFHSFVYFTIAFLIVGRRDYA
ncbi:MAG: ABC transporter permease subunit [Euryarchaeota archaeon]|nr:ABC transporter permease subunit [Euryarchaeota archaeon]